MKEGEKSIKLKKRQRGLSDVDRFASTGTTGRLLNGMQTCTHFEIISATQTCNAAIHGPWTHFMIEIKYKEHYNNHVH